MLGQKKLFPLKGDKLRNQIEINVISNSDASQIMVAHHYLHRARTGGQQLSYGVFYNGECLGALVYASPTFIKKKGLIPPFKQGEVIELARMWLADSMPKFSETCSLAKSIKQIRKDWFEKYGLEVKAIISFADLEADHGGTIYKAANFEDWGFAKYARFADIGKTYSRNLEKWGKRWSGGEEIAKRTNKTKRTYVYKF